MQASQSSWNREAFRLGSTILYHSRALKLFDFLSDRFQPKRRAHGQIVFPYVERKKSRSVQILVYHRVNDDGDALFPALPPALFKAQMEYLCDHCSPCSLEEAVERLGRNDIPDNAVVVTFDDGYRDNYLHAFPILRQCRVPATIFLATGAIGSGEMIWHDRVFRAFRDTHVPALEGLKGIDGSHPVRTRDERRSTQALVLQLLWHLSDEERLERIDRLEERLALRRGQAAPGLMLDWKEVAVMAEQGISFGSHSISHPILANLPDARLREEIEASKQAIEKTIGRQVTCFAYPVGRRQDFNERVKRVVRDAGYRCAVTTIFGVNDAGQDPFELRRGTPWESDLPSFAAKLSWYKFVANG